MPEIEPSSESIVCVGDVFADAELLDLLVELCAAVDEPADPETLPVPDESLGTDIDGIVTDGIDSEEPAPVCSGSIGMYAGFAAAGDCAGIAAAGAVPAADVAEAAVCALDVLWEYSGSAAHRA